MKSEIPVFLGFLLAVLFIGAVGGFLLYVPPLSIITVATMLLGLGFMFALGLQTGRKWKKLSRDANRSTFSAVH
jgi:hypothetical protein